MSDRPGSRIDERLQFRTGLPTGTVIIPEPADKVPAEPVPAIDETARIRPPAIGYTSGNRELHNAQPSRLLEVLRIFARRIPADFVEESARGGLFLLTPVLFGLGVIIYFSLSVEPDASALVTGLAFITVCLWFARKRLRLRMAVVTVLLVVAGMAAGKLETWRAGTTMLGAAVTTRISGEVLQMEALANGRVRLLIDLQTTSRPKLRHQPQRVRLTARSVPAGIAPGSTIIGLARLFPARGPLAEHAYDFAFENYFDGIGANGFFLGTPKQTARKVRPVLATRFVEAIETIRLSMHQHILARLPGEEGQIASALITGTKRGISEDTNEALRRTGLAHIHSISGLHMALAAGTVMGLLRALFALFPDFGARHPVRKYAAGAALAGALAYLFISGAGVATQRSFVMLAVMLVALLFDRAAITMRNLAIAALLMLAVAPHELMGPSFQMSFAATAALVAAYGYWNERAARNNHPAPSGPVRNAFYTGFRYAGALGVTSIVAGLATMVFAAFHFNRIAPLGLPANLAAMPVVSTLVMPPAVFGVLLMPFDLDGPAFAIMGKGISAVTAIAQWFAGRTAGDVIGTIPVSTVVSATLALAAFALTTTRLRAVAMPLLMISVATFLQRDGPEILISEDAKLVAVRTGSGALAVNTARPSDFVLGDWIRRMQASGVLLPEEYGAGAEEISRKFGPTGGEGAFSCNGGLCAFRTSEGFIVAHAETRAGKDRACDFSHIIIVADATIRDGCPDKAVRILSARELALYGTARIRISQPSGLTQRPFSTTAPFLNGQPDGTAPDAITESPATLSVTISLAIPDLTRPWHNHRAYSRAARGLAEREPPDKAAQPGSNNQ